MTLLSVMSFDMRAEQSLRYYFKPVGIFHRMIFIADCQNITPPANGSVTYVNGSTTYKAVAAFGCNDGFVLSGNAIQTCSANGSWAGYTPECNIGE